jgi:hypothetical protein
MSSCHNPCTNLEALLRDACRRALNIGLSFTNQLRIYRSVIALAREVRLRAGGARFDATNETLSALLATVCEHASAFGMDPELLAVQLSRAARQAGGTEPAGRLFFAQEPQQREKPPEPAFSARHPAHREDLAQPEADAADYAQHPMHPEKPSEPAFSIPAPLHREDPAQPEATAADCTQHPLQPETEAPDDSLSAWRNDHKTDRDRRAYEKLRTAIDERPISKVKAMNKRDREAREEAA